MEKKIGRPKSDNPKDITIRCRINKELHEKLVRYCELNSITKSEVMVEGIKIIIDKGVK